MPARVPHIVDPEKATRLPSGGFLVPRGPKQNLTPLDPEKSLTGAQKVWIRDAIATALNPLLVKFDALVAALSKLAPDEVAAILKGAPSPVVAVLSKGKPAKTQPPTSPPVTPPPPVPAPTATPATPATPASTPATPASATTPPVDPVTDPPVAASPAVLALLATVTIPALRKVVAAILKRDAPEPVRLAEARAAIKAADKRREALGNAMDADE